MDLLHLARKFGPGMILMMTGIGTSHVVTAPTAGGRYEFALLWCIPIAYVFKYYGFEMAFRFTNATGQTMIEAYATAWKKWPLWYVLVTTLIQSAVGQAGRLIAASAALYSLVSMTLGVELPVPAYALLLGVISVAVMLRGSYAALETATKAFAGALLAASVAVYFVRPAPLSAFQHFFIFETPEGSWLVVAAFLGLMPTGLDVSLQASEWGKAKHVGAARIRQRLEETGLAGRFNPFAPRREDLTARLTELPPDAREYCERWFRISLWDFRVGHVISFAIVCIFLMLAAVWLYPSAVEGQAVMGEIAGIFSASVGPWMSVAFLVGAFAATFSTAFNYFDGWPRVVGACCRNLFRPTASLRGTARHELTPERRTSWYSEYNIYRATMLFSLVSAVGIIAGLPRPVFLVLVASALALFIAPVVYFLNLYYCLTVIPREDPVFYPTRFERWFAWTSFGVFTLLTLIVILAQLFDIRILI